MVLPFILVLLSFIVHVVIYFTNKRLKSTLITSFKASMLILLNLMYMRVATKAFEVMNCREINGTKYLVADLYV